MSTLTFFLLTVTFLLGACATTPRFEGSIEDHIDVIFANHKGQLGYDRFKSNLISAFNDYLAYKPNGFKAFAIARDTGGRFAYGRGYGSNNIDVGKRFALNYCNKARKQLGVGAGCVIFAKGDRVVLKSY